MDREMDMTRCGASIGRDAHEWGFTVRQCGQTIGIEPVLGVDGKVRFACARWGHRADVVRQWGEMPDPMEPDWLLDEVRDHPADATVETEYARR